MQISIVSSKGMLVSREFTSKLPIKKSGRWSTISSAKWKESYTVNSLVVKGFKIGTKNFADLSVGVFKTDKIGRNGGRSSTFALCTLHEPGITRGLLPTSFNDLPFFSVILVDSTSFLRTLLTCFSWLSSVIFQIY